jgi:ketosteroid isomerase-like protein
MSEAVNKQLARRWFEEVWNQGRESTIDELLHPEGKAYGFPEPDSVLVGPEGFKAIHRAFHNAYGDIHIDIDDLIAEGDRVAIRWTCTMTHTGDGLGFPASSFIHCRDGKLTSGWNFMDLTKTTQQLQNK